MSARFASGVFLALGFADLAVLNLLLAPRLGTDSTSRAETTTPDKAPSAAAKAAGRAPARLVSPPRPAAPKPAPIAAAAQPARARAAPDVRFALASDLVTSIPAARSLEQVAREIASDGSRQILLRGHADRLGQPTMNLALSRRRADSVKRYLTLRGAPAGRIAVEALGDTEPADPSDTPAAWAKNRRVEVLWR